MKHRFVADIDDEIVRQLEPAGTGSPLAALHLILSLSRVFHQARVAKAIAYVHIAI